MIYQSVFSWISTVLSILCGVWLVGLALFCLIRWIIFKVRAAKDISKIEKEIDEDLKKYECDEKNKSH